MSYKYYCHAYDDDDYDEIFFLRVSDINSKNDIAEYVHKRNKVQQK